MAGKKKVKSKLPSVAVPNKELNGPKEHDLSKERDNRCVPVAFALVKFVAEMPQMPTGSHIDEKKVNVNDLYLEPTQKFLKLLIDSNVKVNEIEYIFSITFQAFEYIKKTILGTVNNNIDRINELVFDLPKGESDEFTVNKLNEVSMRTSKLSELWKKILAEDIKK